MRAQLMPSRYSGKRNEITATVVGSHPLAPSMVAQGLSSHGWRHSDLYEDIADLFVEAIQSVLVDGVANYELRVSQHPQGLFGHEESEDDPGEQWFSLGPVHMQSRMFRKQQSKLLSSDREDRELLSFRLPLDDERILSDMIRKLARLPSSVYPDWTIADISAFSEGKFDPVRFSEATKMIVAEIAAPVGWPVRGSLDNLLTEYLQVYWLLRYEALKVRIRNCFIGTLNMALANVGRRLETHFQVSIEGLPSIDDIINIEGSLVRGELTLEAVYTRFLS